MHTTHNEHPMPAEMRAWLVCKRCLAPCKDRNLSKGEYLRCGRCHAQLKSFKQGNSFNPLWAFSSTALICMVLANTYPILNFEVAGKSQQNLILTGIQSLWSEGFGLIAALVFFCTIVAPTIYLGALWYMGGACTLEARWPGLRLAAKTAAMLESLNLLPVFAVACIVSVVKLRTIGNVTWDMGAFWIGAASLFTLLSMQAHNSGQIEIQLEQSQ
jgi:paraquat-inducible protein A